MAVVPDTELEYLVRRFTLEKGFAVLADKEKGFAPAIRSVDESRFGYELPAVHYYELDPLRPHFDVTLVRADGINFVVLGLSKVDVSPRQPVEQETLISVGKACLRYTGKMSGQRMPVIMEVMEIHEHDFEPGAVDHLKGTPVRYASEKVFVNAYAVGFASGRVWSGGSISHRGRRRYLKRILAAKGEPEHQMVEAVAASGVSLPHILLGAMVGVLLTLGLRYLLAVLGTEGGPVYGFADLVGATAAAGIAVLARRIRSSSIAQAVISALLYTVFLYGGLMAVFGTPFSFWMPVNAVIFAATASWIGRTSEMA